MKKEEKVAIIDQLTTTIGEYAHVYLADIAGLDSVQTSNLRRECFNNGIKLMVVKNTLLKKAFESLDADYSQAYDSLVGSTSIMLSNTGNAPAKLIKSFSKDNKKPVLKGAFVEQSYYGADQLDALVSLKSKNELIADIVALLQSPAKNVISGLKASAGDKILGELETLSKR